MKIVTFVTLSSMFVALICSLSSATIVSAVPPDPGWGSEPRCFWEQYDPYYTCCWSEGDTTYCQSCTQDEGGVWDCKEKEETPISVQPPTETPTPPKGGGQGLFGSNDLPPSASSDDSGVVEQPPLTLTEPITPEDNRDDEDGSNDGGGGKPPRGNVLPENGIGDQPELKQPDEPSNDGQDDQSNEGQDTAGPLT